MTPEQLKELRKAAEEATPGPWKTYINTMDNVIVRKLHDSGYEQCVISYKSHYKNARHISAANPATIMQLLDYVESLERDATRYRYLLADIERCYRMLLTEPDTKGALFKAENILREAIASVKEK